MKKIFTILGAVLAVSACANDYDCSGENYEEQCPCQEAAPAPQPCNECARAQTPVVQAPVAQPTCGTCQGEVRTVREPVEVVYRRRTFGTVYEPRYFENVSYERQNLGGGYYQQQVVVETDTETVVPAQPQVVAPTVSAPAPAASARRYNGPVVVVPAQ